MSVRAIPSRHVSMRQRLDVHAQQNTASGANPAAGAHDAPPPPIDYLNLQQGRAEPSKVVSTSLEAVVVPADLQTVPPLQRLV